MLEDNNEDVVKLGEYWDAVTGPIKAGVQAVVHLVVAWGEAVVSAIKNNRLLNLVVDKSVELFNYLKAAIAPIIGSFTNMYTAATKALGAWFEGTGIAKAVTAAMEVFMDYAYEGFENLKVAIDQATHLFWVMKDAAAEALTPIVAYLADAKNGFMDTFGDRGISAIAAWGGAIKDWVLDKVELVGIFVRNWPDFFEIAYLEIVDYLSSIGEAMATIPANAAIIGNYIANNWLKYFQDVGTNIQALFTNLTHNLQSIWTAFQDWINGENGGGFHPTFDALTKGMVSTVDALPELVKPALDAHLARLNAIADIEERIGDKVFARHKESAKAAETTAAAAPAQADPFKSTSFNTADFSARIRMAINSTDKADVPARQLTELQKIAKSTKDAADEAKKPKTARLA
jgi:hypothetical protein